MTSKAPTGLMQTVSAISHLHLSRENLHHRPHSSVATRTPGNLNSNPQTINSSLQLMQLLTANMIS
ncbi:MAG: hypothetical protein MUE37_08215 [Bacteroidales bacterium]|nr:hypothetical protein [Bacteroidales bacterium]